MKPKLLLTIAAIYMGLVGLGYLISPVGIVLGLDQGAPAALIAEIRIISSTFIGIAVLNWAARNADASKARDAIFLGNTVGFGLAAILGIIATLATGQALGWIFVVIAGLFAVGFFIVGRANMSTSAS